MELLGIITGFLLGLVSGFVPGIHSNTLASIITQLELNSGTSVSAIAAMACSHAVFGFIPAIFLFIPDSETVVSVLPGHRMLLEGRGRYALLVCSFSGIVSIALSVLMLPVAFFLLPFLYSLIRPLLLPILFLASCFLLFSEKIAWKIGAAFLLFILSGALGLFALKTPVLNDPLLAVFSGLFAISGVLISMRQDTRIPPQKEEKVSFTRKYVPYIFTGVLLGMLSDLLPGISSPAQIAVFAALFLYMNAPKFLSFVSSVAISHSIFSFLAIHTLGKARTGAAVAIKDLIGVPSIEQTLWLIGIGVLSASVSIFVLVLISKKLPSILGRVQIRKLGSIVLVYLTVIVFVIDGPMGLLFMVTGASIGVIAPLAGVRRTHLMGAILVPSMVSIAEFGSFFLSLTLGN